MASDNKPVSGMLQRRLPLAYTLLICLGFITVIYWQSTFQNANGNLPSKDTTAKVFASNASKMDQQRSSDYKYIRPLYLTDVLVESEEFNTLKNEISTILQQKTTAGILNTSSVYFRKMDDGSWFSLNANDGFHPGSLVKVPILIAYLKMAEYNPSLLNKEILFNQQFTNLPVQAYPEQTIRTGKKYTIRDLLHHMIVYSDNNATVLLTSNMNTDVFKKLFTDIGIPEPPLVDPNFQMSAFQISKFMRLLYSATYVNRENSEFALSLLSQAKFNDGIKAGLPATIQIAHKFGEAGPVEMRELHETAIVYVGDNTYLLTIMTSGKDIHALALVLKEVSALVYQNMAGTKTPS